MNVPDQHPFSTYKYRRLPVGAALGDEPTGRSYFIRQSLQVIALEVWQYGVLQERVTTIELASAVFQNKVTLELWQVGVMQDKVIRLGLLHVGVLQEKVTTLQLEAVQNQSTTLELMDVNHCCSCSLYALVARALVSP